MSEDSIDFQPIPGENTEKKEVRNLFRVPVTLKDDIRFIWGEKQYVVPNLSETGVAVNVSSCLEFDSGQIIENARLRIGDSHLMELCAKVIHCSVHDSGSFQFGLQWVNMSAENKKKLDQSLGQLKEQALKGKDLFENDL